MKILVLGGTKFFGKEYVKRAIAQGHEITVMSRREPSPDIKPYITHVQGNRSDSHDLRPLAKKSWELVIDNICFNEDEAKLATELFTGQVACWVFTSTASIYFAFKNNDLPVFNEDWAGSNYSGPERKLEEFPYGVNKWRAEQAFKHAFDKNKFPVVSLRLPMVMGPEDPMQRSLHYLHRIKDGGPIILPDGCKNKWRNLYSKDAARAFELAAGANNIFGKAFNIADVETTTVRDWITICYRAMGVNPYFVEIPINWLNSKKFDYSTAPLASTMDFKLETQKAEHAFGWNSTPIKDWIADTVDWFKMTDPKPPENYKNRKAELDLVEEWKTAHAKK